MCMEITCKHFHSRSLPYQEFLFKAPACVLPYCFPSRDQSHDSTLQVIYQAYGCSCAGLRNVHLHSVIQVAHMKAMNQWIGL